MDKKSGTNLQKTRALGFPEIYGFISAWEKARDSVHMAVDRMRAAVHRSTVDQCAARGWGSPERSTAADSGLGEWLGDTAGDPSKDAEMGVMSRRWRNE